MRSDQDHSAGLIAFPQRRNVGKARHVAALWMHRRPGRERDAYWTNVCKRYREVMARQGFPAHIVDRELRGFLAAVEEQILAIQQRTEEHVLNRAADFIEAHRLEEAISEMSADFRGQRDGNVTSRHVTPSPDTPPGAA